MSYAEHALGVGSFVATSQMKPVRLSAGKKNPAFAGFSRNVKLQFISA